MRTVPGMATTTVENQPFSRIVEQRKTSSWSIGLPVAILAVVIVALLAWLAAKWSQSSQALTAAQQDLAEGKAVWTRKLKFGAYCVAFTPDGKAVVTGHDNGSCYVTPLDAPAICVCQLHNPQLFHVKQWGIMLLDWASRTAGGCPHAAAHAALDLTHSTPRD